MCCALVAYQTGDNSSAFPSERSAQMVQHYSHNFTPKNVQTSICSQSTQWTSQLGLRKLSGKHEPQNILKNVFCAMTLSMASPLPSVIVQIAVSRKTISQVSSFAG